MTYARLMLKRFEVGLNNFASPFLETLQPCKTKDIFIGLVILLAAFAAFASLSTEALINGDAAVYLQQMQNLDFTDRPVHLGYYLLGAGFIRILPGSDDHAINLMNCFLGALSIMLVYFITFTICHKHIPAIACEPAAFYTLYVPRKFNLRRGIYPAGLFLPPVDFTLAAKQTHPCEPVVSLIFLNNAKCDSCLTLFFHTATTLASASAVLRNFLSLCCCHDISGSSVLFLW